MLVPFTHERMTVQRLPWVTIGLVLVNCVVFLLTWPAVSQDALELVEIQQRLEGLVRENPGIANEDFQTDKEMVEYQDLVARFEDHRSHRFFAEWGFVPARQEWSTLLTSMFLHAGWAHLLGNMYLLWLCGASIEDLWGRPVFLAVYVVCGGAAAMTHAAMTPDSLSPLVGASGAISGVLGAFLIRLYDTRIRFFYWFLFFFGTFKTPAWFILPLWLGNQVMSAVLYGDGSPVAFWAHIGGFVFGVLVALYFKITLVEDAFLAPAIEEKTTLFAQHDGVVRALELIDASKYREAIEPLRAALGSDANDVDAFALLGQCHQALGDSPAAANAWRSKLRVHLRKREKEFAYDAYRELQATGCEDGLTPREQFSFAGIVGKFEDGYEDASKLYRAILDGSSDVVAKLKAGLALAELYDRSQQRPKAVALLHELRPLAEEHPSWSLMVSDKLAVFQAAPPSP